MIGSPTVVVESSAGNIGYLRLHGARKHAARIQALREGYPRVETTIGSRPRAVRHVLRQGIQHGLATLSVHCTIDLNLAVPVITRQVAREKHLTEHTRRQNSGLRSQHQLRANGVRSKRPANTHTGREHLRNRTQVDNALGRPRTKCGKRIGIKTKQAVRVIFQNQHVFTHADFSDQGATLQRKRDARRIVEVRDRVEELNGATGGLQATDRLF